ncbi:MAG TPA: polysaccharide deacetylase family protein [Candidatus Omnitrophota bacterium]|nr:polysaccharide deacetylase family protein [Candidatus Omnitrophota bacterium]
MKRILTILFFITILAGAAHPQIYTHGFNHRQVALTFDDGPSPLYTEMVLDILKKYHVPATFFVIGYKVAENPDLIVEIARDGHEIGNHTYYHSRLNWVNGQKLLGELKMTSDLIANETGLAVNLFRPPHGYLNPEKRALIEKAGYGIVQWSVNADDFYHSLYGMRNPSSIASRVLSRITGGDIVLMHDTSAQTVVALPKIIRALKGHGYQFVTVSKLVGLHI